jgi:hypothetical protein
LTKRQAISPDAPSSQDDPAMRGVDRRAALIKLGAIGVTGLSAAVMAGCSGSPTGSASGSSSTASTSQEGKSSDTHSSSGSSSTTTSALGAGRGGGGLVAGSYLPSTDVSITCNTATPQSGNNSNPPQNFQAKGKIGGEVLMVSGDLTQSPNGNLVYRLSGAVGAVDIKTTVTFSATAISLDGALGDVPISLTLSGASDKVSALTGSIGTSPVRMVPVGPTNVGRIKLSGTWGQAPITVEVEPGAESPEYMIRGTFPDGNLLLSTSANGSNGVGSGTTTGTVSHDLIPSVVLALGSAIGGPTLDATSE